MKLKYSFLEFGVNFLLVSVDLCWKNWRYEIVILYELIGHLNAKKIEPLAFKNDRKT